MGGVMYISHLTSGNKKTSDPSKAESKAALPFFMDYARYGE
jgi:hypothetical protein